MLTKEINVQKYYRYQGRKTSKKISKSNLNLLKNFYEDYSYDREIIEFFESNDKSKRFNWNTNNYTKVNIEIGFGDGEFLLKNAINNPHELFIGIEFYKNGIIKILKKILEQQINNIKLCNLNAEYFLKALPTNSVDNLLIINPDPWPKKRHHKRRLISFENIKVFRRIIKSKDSIYITTDSTIYTDYIESIFINNVKLLGDYKIITLSHYDHLYAVSRYQRKAIKSGRKIYQITI